MAFSTPHVVSVVTLSTLRVVSVVISEIILYITAYALVWVSEWWLFLKANWAFLQLYHDENELTLDKIMIIYVFSRPMRWRVDMSLHSDTLSRLRANQSFFALIPLCYLLRGESWNTNCIVFGLTRMGSNPRTTSDKKES
jgi:hypothetical protein